MAAHRAAITAEAPAAATAEGRALLRRSCATRRLIWLTPTSVAAGARCGVAHVPAAGLPCCPYFLLGCCSARNAAFACKPRRGRAAGCWHSQPPQRFASGSPARAALALLRRPATLFVGGMEQTAEDTPFDCRLLWTLLADCCFSCPPSCVATTAACVLPSTGALASQCLHADQPCCCFCLPACLPQGPARNSLRPWLWRGAGGGQYVCAPQLWQRGALTVLCSQVMQRGMQVLTVLGTP